jgi:exodeoxyribonuclease-3
VLAATIGEFRVINLYVPNGQAPGSEKFAYKLKWLEALTRWLRPKPRRIRVSWC